MNERTAICDAVEAASGRVLLVPWGNVSTLNGDAMLINEEAAGNMIGAFKAHGVDLVIDAEHTSEGGKFARPDNLAPAMGWVKQGSMEAVPGQGIFGQVEWTPEGQRLVFSKSYKYLSPVITYRAKDGVALRMRSAGLVNQPAIPRMPALVNKESSNHEENKMEQLLTYLREKAGLPADASAETILVKCKEVDVVVAANKSLSDKLVLFAGELGENGKPLAEALAKGEAEAIANGLRTTVNRLANDPSKVNKSEVETLRGEVKTLQAKLANGDCEALIAANSNKLAPTNRPWFKDTYARDPEFAKKWIAEAPELVHNTPAPAAKTGPLAGDRATAINAARATFAEGGAWGGRSEREFIDGQLLSINKAKITDEEATKLGI